MEQDNLDLGAWLGLATGGGAVWCTHEHDGERRPAPVRLDAMLPHNHDEQAARKQRIKDVGDEDRPSPSNGPCLSDGCSGTGGRRRKLRLTKEQCAPLEDSFRAHNILSRVQKQELARRLKVSSRQVEVWFQNRRARTKQKQTGVDCEFLKRWCESLTHENHRLKRDLLELQRSAAAPVAAGSKFFAQLPRAEAVLKLCPSSRPATAIDKVAVNN